MEEEPASIISIRGTGKEGALTTLNSLTPTTGKTGNGKRT
jgi:hypothetical protein